MIKFFRNIRKSLLMENKTSKYLKYASGEIVLVVIGILIALQINNWNEKKQNEDKITAILEDIQKDLSEDVLSANYVFNRYIKNDSLRKLFLNNELPATSYNFIYRYANFVIHKTGYLNLTQNSNSIPKKFANLFKDLNKLYVNTASDISVFNERIRATVYNGIDYVAKNKTWFIDFNQQNMTPELEEFFRTDMNYRNQMGLYMNDLVNLTDDANEYKVNAIDMYNKIDSLLGHKNPIPGHITYQLADTTLLKQFEGQYKWLEGLEDYKEETIVVKAKDGNIFLGKTTDKESEYNKLYWFKDKTFFRWSDIISFSSENGKTILNHKVYNGYEKWVKQ